MSSARHALIYTAILLPFTCLAASHSAPSYLSFAVVLMLFAALTAIINFYCFRQAGRAPSLTLLRTLRFCLLVNIAWLCYSIYTMYHRYRQHLGYTEFGDAMDKIGYDNFKTKAIPITIMICIAIILDILFIIRVGNDLNARDAASKR